MLFNIKNKGQIFLMSVLILSAVIAMGILLIGTYTRDLRLAYQTGQSGKAFYASDAAMEWQMYKVFAETEISGPPSTLTENNCYPNISGQINCGGSIQIGSNSSVDFKVTWNDCPGTLRSDTKCDIRTSGSDTNTARSSELHIGN